MYHWQKSKNVQKIKNWNYLNIIFLLRIWDCFRNVQFYSEMTL